MMKKEKKSKKPAKKKNSKKKNGKKKEILKTGNSHKVKPDRHRHSTGRL